MARKLVVLLPTWGCVSSRSIGVGEGRTARGRGPRRHHGGHHPEVASLPSEALAEPLRSKPKCKRRSTRPPRATSRRRRCARISRITRRRSRAWVYTPRRARPAYRYKKTAGLPGADHDGPSPGRSCSRMARTLEHRLLDVGARVWPLEAEVHLYETMPGGQLGHLAASRPKRRAWASRPADESSSSRLRSWRRHGLARPGAPVPGLPVVVPGMRVR